MTALLRRMVRVDTVNPALPGGGAGESRLVDELEALCVGWGLATRRLAVAELSDQLLVTCPPEAKAEAGRSPWVLFDSHLDTVAVEGMTIDPFGGERRDGRVWGRGAADTKGTGAAMLWALREHAAAGGGPNGVALLFSVDEEVSMRGVASFVAHDLPRLAEGWGGVPCGVIVGEPTELRPVAAHQGVLRWAVTTRGRACHSSVPHEGVSAISAMVRVVERIEGEYVPSVTAEHPLTGSAACSVNVIRGGSASNIIPDACTIEVDRRVSPGEDAAAVTAGFEACLAPLRGQDPPVDFAVEVAVDQPPLGTDRNGPLTEVVQQTLAELGLPTLTLGAPFATHAATLDAAGVPAVVIGPGSPHTAHTRDEWVAVDQIERGVALYRALMQSPRFADANGVR